MDIRIRNFLQQLQQPTTGPTTPNQGVINQDMMSNTGYNQSEVDSPDYGNNILEQISKLFNPSHYASDQLRTEVGRMPDRANYQPKMLQKVGGFMTALGSGAGPAGMWGGTPVGFRGGDPIRAIAAGDAVRNRDFNQAMGDWKEKIDPLAKMAGYENASNNVQRQHINDMNRARYQESEHERRTQEGIKRDEVARGNLRVREAHANIAAFKANNPKHEIKVNEKGYLIGINPLDNTGSIILYDNGEPIKSNELSDAEKINLGIQGRIAVANVQGNIGSRQIGERADREDRQIDRRAETEEQHIVSRGNQDLRRDAAKALTPENATQRRIDLLVRAQQAQNINPEWTPYIHMLEDNQFRVMAPDDAPWHGFESPGGAKARQDKHKSIIDEINQYIYGTNVRPMPSHGTPPPPPAAAKPKDNNDDRVTVIDLKTGKPVATIPRSNIGQLDKSKYKVQ